MDLLRRVSFMRFIRQIHRPHECHRVREQHLILQHNPFQHHANNHYSTRTRTGTNAKFKVCAGTISIHRSSLHKVNQWLIFNRLERTPKPPIRHDDFLPVLHMLLRQYTLWPPFHQRQTRNKRRKERRSEHELIRSCPLDRRSYTLTREPYCEEAIPVV